MVEDRTPLLVIVFVLQSPLESFVKVSIDGHVCAHIRNAQLCVLVATLAPCNDEIPTSNK